MILTVSVIMGCSKDKNKEEEQTPDQNYKYYLKGKIDGKDFIIGTNVQAEFQGTFSFATYMPHPTNLHAALLDITYFNREVAGRNFLEAGFKNLINRNLLEVEPEGAFQKQNIEIFIGVNKKFYSCKSDNRNTGNSFIITKVEKIGQSQYNLISTDPVIFANWYKLSGKCTLQLIPDEGSDEITLTDGEFAIFTSEFDR